MTLPLVYLDHNILDHMSKGDPDRIIELLRDTSLTPVFSQENLQEIRRSRSREEQFLKLLESIGAQYLVSLVDEHFHYSGKAEVQRVNPFDAYRSYIENVAPMPELGYGLAGMLQKLYGGRRDESFERILSSGADELDQLLQEAQKEIESLPELSEVDRLVFQNELAVASEAAKHQCKSLAAVLDSDAKSGAALKQFEDATGLGPRVLNNVRPPGVLRKIWALVEAKIPACEQDLETFFGIKPGAFSAKTKSLSEILCVRSGENLALTWRQRQIDLQTK